MTELKTYKFQAMLTIRVTAENEAEARDMLREHMIPIVGENGIDEIMSTAINLSVDAPDPQGTKH